MKEIYKSLFTPFKIGNVKIKNRFVMCPMTGTAIIMSSIMRLKNSIWKELRTE